MANSLLETGFVQPKQNIFMENDKYKNVEEILNFSNIPRGGRSLCCLTNLGDQLEKWKIHNFYFGGVNMKGGAKGEAKKIKNNKLV